MKFIFNDCDPKRTLTNILKKEKVDLIIVDAWADLFTGNTNDVAQVRKSLNGLSGIAERYGCAIMMLHHTIKNSEYHTPNKNRLNGSQGIEAKLRALIEIREGDNNERILSILKGNYISNGEKSKSIVLKFDEESLSFLTTGKKVEKSSLIQKDGYRFNDDSELADLIFFLKNDRKFSFQDIYEWLSAEWKGRDIPSVTTLKRVLRAQ